MDKCNGRLIISGEELTFEYKGISYTLTSSRYEPCTYISIDNKIVCTLHNAFTTDHLADAFLNGGTVKGLDWVDYDKTAFCKALAAALDSGRAELDFTYAAKLSQQTLQHIIPKEEQ